MISCQLCDREFKNERGIYVHLARTHGIRGPRGRLSLRTNHQFFSYLQTRKWRKAERFLDGVNHKDLRDEWIKGYAHSLSGMILALKTNRSPSQPTPYILKIDEYDRKQLQEAEKSIVKRTNAPFMSEFEQGFFHAWKDYLHHRWRNESNQESRKTPINTKTT